MICEPYDCLFVHIPKTGGQSVEHFFMRRLGLDWDDDREQLLLQRASDESQGTEKLAHLSASEYVGCGHIDQPTFDRLFKFTFVRNPWERLVSEYRYRNYLRYFSFSDFVLNKLPKSGFSDEYRHVMPQYDMLHDGEGNLLVDFVGRFESLQRDFDSVCSRLGIHETMLPHVNSSDKTTRHLRRWVKNALYFNGENRKRHYSEFYDDRTRQRVDDLYARDAEAFGYEFQAA